VERDKKVSNEVKGGLGYYEGKEDMRTKVRETRPSALD
jgi:hypothetical protein